MVGTIGGTGETGFGNELRGGHVEERDNAQAQRIDNNVVDDATRLERRTDLPCGVWWLAGAGAGGWDTARV